MCVTAATCNRHLVVLSGDGGSKRKAKAASKLRGLRLDLDAATQSDLIAKIDGVLEGYSAGLKRQISGSIQRRVKRIVPVIADTHGMVQRLLAGQQAKMQQPVGASCLQPSADTLAGIDAQIALLRSQRRLAVKASKKATARGKPSRRRAASRGPTASERPEDWPARCAAALERNAARKARQAAKKRGDVSDSTEELESDCPEDRSCVDAIDAAVVAKARAVKKLTDAELAIQQAARRCRDAMRAVDYRVWLHQDAQEQEREHRPHGVEMAEKYWRYLRALERKVIKAKMHKDAASERKRVCVQRKLVLQKEVAIAMDALTVARQARSKAV